ncbi:MAG: M20/M25/M40 family metallo-hydrolase, partial [Acetobacteraceae bacterium]|nr:M20/M25/M40 family metallo-hydrolase [Acetobacteraceae bacterium]
MPNIELGSVTSPTADACTLVAELEATLSANYEPHQRHGLKLDAIFQPHIRFFVARLDGEPVGCGGIALFDGFAEVKRMYVRAAVRGQGVAPAILARLEQEASAAGYDTIRLETGTLQHAAMRFYLRSGYTTCGPFGDYVRMAPEAIEASVFMAKRLVPKRDRPDEEKGNHRLALPPATGQLAPEPGGNGMSASRDGAIDRALAFFDGGGFEQRLGKLVAVQSTSQEPSHRADLDAYLAEIRPWLESMGFTATIHPNPVEGSGPILLAERLEGSGPTVITYGHGDTVRGLEDQWEPGLDPWCLTRKEDRWYGRGSADNKGQHVINLSALEAVLAERGGKLGFNVKLIIETGEESGSKGLSEIVAANKEKLAADVLLASDGPRVNSAVPTLSTGTRGSFHFDLIVDIRPGGVHSGNWGGMTTDPAIVLAHAIASIADRHGKILVRDWVPKQLSNSVREVLHGCELVAEGEAASIDPDWGEPGLTPAEKIYGWTSFIVLSMLSGRPENPVNAVAPNAIAHCQIRYTVDVDPYSFEAALRGHLDEHGFQQVAIRPYGIRMPARRSDPANPWVRWAAAS